MDLLSSFDSLISPWHRLQPEIDSSLDRKLEYQFERSTRNEDKNSNVNFQKNCDQQKLKSPAKFLSVPEFSIQPLFPFTFDLPPQVNNKDQEQQQQQQQQQHQQQHQQQQHLETEANLTPLEQTNEWLKNLCQKRQQKRYR